MVLVVTQGGGGGVWRALLLLQVPRRPGLGVLAFGSHREECHGLPLKQPFLWEKWRGPVPLSTLQVTTVRDRELSQDGPRWRPPDAFPQRQEGRHTAVVVTGLWCR